MEPSTPLRKGSPGRLRSSIPQQFNQPRPNLWQRRHFTRGAQGDGGSGHAEDYRGAFVLGDGVGAAAVKVGEAAGAVGAHSGEEHSGGGGAVDVGGAGEEVINGRAGGGGVGGGLFERDDCVGALA